ncbi:amidohydrolase family protein [Pseudomonas putida]|uniref:amidohydrolase family protein n=1 Tax=Pseudomonas putida TaxID=303 RepID=UPI0018AA38F7|nr:amidohydrolase family protein [Pseudomonas putida]MBF8668354.1 amidohydrolase family protein [Pseudomonas putida]MBF8710827.1 amidohydrolase family protein [Pseudomonas putida]
MDGATAREEAIIDAKLPIIDAHHHFWDEAHGKFDYLISDLMSDVRSGHNIVQTVYCECEYGFRQSGPEELRPVGETEYVMSTLAAAGSEAGNLCNGLMMYADMTLGAGVQPVLDAHRAVAGRRFKGIRYIAAHDPSPLVRSFVPEGGVLGLPAVKEAVACLASNGLTFETFVFHPQLEEVARLAAAVPNATIVVSALGGPVTVGPFKGKNREVFENWRASMSELAKQPNVYMQIGGFGAKMYGLGFHSSESKPSTEELASAWQPYFDVCLDAFGASRCLVASNFPQDIAVTSYRQLWNVFKYMSRGLSEQEKLDIFSRTSTKVYSLDM